MKIKKVLSVLAAPLVGIMFFFGCSNGDGSVASVKNEYLKTMNSFTRTYKEENYNNIFANYAHKETPSEMPKYAYFVYPSFNHYSSVNGEELKNEDIQTKVLEYDANGKENTEDQYGTKIDDAAKGLAQFSTVYQTLLSMIFNFYNNWQEDFFGKVNQEAEKAGKIDKNDMKSLFDDAENLKFVLKDFEGIKNKFEEEIILFNVEGQMLQPTIAAFNVEYNKVIEASLKFVKHFETLLRKYNAPKLVLNSKENGKFGEFIGNVGHAKMLYDSTILKLAEAIYLESVKGFENVNVCDITYLQNGFNIKNAKGEDVPTADNYKITKVKDYISYPKDDKGNTVDGIINVKQPDANNGIFKLYETQTTDISFNKSNAETAVQYMEELEAINYIITKEIEIYKHCMNNVDYNRYTMNRANSSKMTEWENNLTATEQINVKGLDDFNNSKISQVLNILNKVLNFEIINQPI